MNEFCVRRRSKFETGIQPQVLGLYEYLNSIFLGGRRSFGQNGGNCVLWTQSWFLGHRVLVKLLGLFALGGRGLLRVVLVLVLLPPK